MNAFQRIWRWLRSLGIRPVVKQEIDEELRFHLEQATAENIAAGMASEEAAREARKRFGNVQSVREECRDVRGASFADATLRNLRFAVRQLIKKPGFTIAALATLAICIGANLTIFAVVDSVLLRPLPFPDADRLVTMFNTYPGAKVDRDGSSVANYYERRDGIPAIASLSLFRYQTAVIGKRGDTKREDVIRISHEFFETLGVSPVQGRAFTDEEMTYQTDAVVILTEAYARQYFNGDSDVLGHVINVDGVPKTVVGVLPPGFRFLSSHAQLFLPLASTVQDRSSERRHWGSGSDIVARLKPDVTVAEAQAQIDAQNDLVEQDISKAEAEQMAKAGFRTLVTPLHADHVRSVRSTLLLLQGGVSLLLAIGCVNLINLLLIRASDRAKEFAIRRALGASRRHLLSQSTTETVLLAVVGGLIGLAVGADHLPLGASVAFDGRLALIALLGSVLMGILFAVPINWFNLRSAPLHALQSESRGGTKGLPAQRLRHGFIVAQIALAFVLLAGAGLLGVSLKRAMAVSPGFQADHLLTGQISLPNRDYQGRLAQSTFLERLMEGVQGLPGVSTVGTINNIPLSGDNQLGATHVKDHVLQPGESPRASYRYGISGDYFPAMGISLREGRFLETADSRRAEKVCVVDESFARYYWPEGEAVGRQLFQGPNEGPDTEAFTIVGVVGTVKQAALTEQQPQGAVYFPFRYNSDGNLFVVVRTSQKPEALASALRTVVRNIDPELPVNDLQTMEVRVSDSLIMQRSPALLAGLFALVALLLAAVGTYGVLSYVVTQRRREIGVRLALGALPGQIGRHFLSIGLRLLAIGTMLGMIGALLAGRALRNILFGVAPLHIPILVGTTLVLGVVSLAASLLPALRASRVDPMEALRDE